MLPTGAARSPPATSIEAVSRVVVVLPLVPVISIQSAGVPSGCSTLSRTRHASSMSPHRAVPLSWVHAITGRSEEHTSELQSLMRISYAVFCLKKKKKKHYNYTHNIAHKY